MKWPCRQMATTTFGCQTGLIAFCLHGHFTELSSAGFLVRLKYVVLQSASGESPTVNDHLSKINSLLINLLIYLLCLHLLTFLLLRKENLAFVYDRLSVFVLVGLLQCSAQRGKVLGEILHQIASFLCLLANLERLHLFLENFILRDDLFETKLKIYHLPRLLSFGLGLIFVTTRSIHETRLNGGNPSLITI